MEDFKDKLGKKPLNDEEFMRAEEFILKTIQEKKRRRTTKADKIRTLYFQLRRLRQDGLSWKDLSIYLKEFHKIKISQRYLREIYMCIEKESF